MFIRLFRSSFLLQNTLIVFIAVVLWIPSFLRPLPPAPVYGLQPLYAGIAALLQPFPLLSVIIAFFLMVFSAFYFNAVLAANGLIGRVASAAALIFVIFFSFTPQQTLLYPLLLSLPLLIFLLSVQFKMYETQSNEFNIFNLAFVISLLSMLDIRYLILFIWLYVSLFILRIIKLKEWLIPFFGLFVPYFFLATYYFMRNHLLSSFAEWQQIPVFYSFQWPVLPALMEGISMVLMVIVFLHSLSALSSPNADHSIFMRKKRASLAALLVFSIAFLFVKPAPLAHSLLILIPFAVYVAHSWMLYRRFYWPQMLFLLLLGLSLFHQYFRLFL